MGQPVFNTDYAGEVEQPGTNLLVLRLNSVVTADRTLYALLPIHMGNQVGFSAGVYLARDHQGNFISGSLIMTRLGDQDTERMEPAFFPTGSPSFQTLPTSVREYLYAKEHSHIKVSRDLTSEVALMTWLENKRSEFLLRPDRYQTYEHDVFLACPISSLKRFKTEEVRRWLQDIKRALEARGFAKVYSAPLEVSAPSKVWNEPSARREGVLRQIRHSRYFMLVYPETVVSSALIETGWALGNQKPCVVFHHVDSRLPQILQLNPPPRNMAPIHARTFQGIEDLLTRIREDAELFEWG